MRLAFVGSASVVELTISCQNLPNPDVTAKVDVMCVAYIQLPGDNKWTEIGRTEIILDNLNPEFSKKIPVGYQFEERQMLRFEVYDFDSAKGGHHVSDHDLIGAIEVSLGEIVSTDSSTAFERPLENLNRTNNGAICIVAEEVTSCKEDFLMKLYADSLPSSLFKTRRYFFEIHKTLENAGGLHLVYRSGKNEPSSGTVDWPQFQLNKYTLCNGDVNRQIVFTLYRFKREGGHQAMGNWNTTLKYFIENINNLPITFKVSSGASFRLTLFSKGFQSSFLDYITFGGVQIQCFLSIDFSASNGHPGQPSSLHYIHPTIHNPYQIAIRSVMEIIQDYDTDKLFPVFGFGAKVPPKFGISHQFNVNLHPSDPNCEGVEGVLKAYAEAVRQVHLDGPSNFAPIINYVSRIARADTDSHNYFVLLIITNGAISDMTETIDAVVAASYLPVSIIIVGLGDGDFSAMEVLDADFTPLVDSNKRTMKRDIVQFVPFNEILRTSGNNSAMAKISLARCVLFELPTQFLTYMKNIGVTAKSLAALRRTLSTKSTSL